MSTDQKGGYPQGYNQPVGYGYSTQGGAVVTQPYQGNMVVVQPTGPRPSDYLIISIVSCFFCWPIAICALVSSCNSKSAADSGDYPTAERQGRTARNIAIAAIVIGAIIIAAIVIWQIIIAVAVASTIRSFPGY